MVPVQMVRILLLTVTTLFFLSACSGGGGENGGSVGGDNEASAPMTYEARKAALDAVAREAQGHQGDPASAERVASALRAMKEFKAAGTAPDGSAWARFTDGRLVIVPGGGAIAASAGIDTRSAASAARLSTAAPASISSSKGLPRGTAATVVFPLVGGPKNYGDAPEVIASWLAEHGYSLVSGAVIKGTVEELERVSGDGVFYFETHMAMGDPSEIRGRAFGLFTATVVTPETEADVRYGDHLGADRLAYMSMPVSLDPYVRELHYAITDKFIQKHMSFGDRSLVYLNGCSALDPSNEPTVNALIEKGAGVVIGWTNQVEIALASDAAQFAFDRLLGNNRAEPKDQQPRPPLDWRELQRTMMDTRHPHTGYPFDTSPGMYGAKLRFRVGKLDEQGEAALTVIVPSVRTAEIVTGYIALGGLFGDVVGSVYVSDSPLALGVPVAGSVFWSPNYITFPTPRSGNYYLRVVVDGRISNPFLLLPRNEAFTKFNEDGTELRGDATSWACVRHNATGLLWEAHVRRTLPWHECYGYTNIGNGQPCDAPSVPGSVGRICGQTGWRLPTADEARVLFGEPGYAAAPKTFSDTWFGTDDEARWAWTSTAGPEDIWAWIIGFDYGSVPFELRSRAAGSVRLVR